MFQALISHQSITVITKKTRTRGIDETSKKSRVEGWCHYVVQPATGMSRVSVFCDERREDVAEHRSRFADIWRP